MSTAGAPSARSRAAYAAISSSGQVFVWGGQDAAAAVLDSGAIYDVATDSWDAVVKDANTPSARSLASAVWTGDRVFVWGGTSGSADLASGALYDPVAKAWSPVSATGAPSARRAPYLVWTGSEVLLWAGQDAAGGGVAGTFRYDPTADKWTTASSGGQPSARTDATTGFTGADFFVYGGKVGGSYSDETHRYRLSTDAWAGMGKGPSQRFGAFGTWDGSYLVAWGGRKPPNNFADGKRFDGTAWSVIQTTGAPSGRYALHRQSGFSARIAAGTTLLIGGFATAALKDGAIYASGTNAWTPVPAWPSGEDHLWPVYAFTGGELVVFGGLNGAAPTATGERFRP